MDARIAALADTLRLNTRLFRNCLDGFTDDRAAARPTPDTNSAAFIAAHLADSRFYLLKLLGGERANPLTRYLGTARGIDDITEWPTLQETLSAWTDVSHALRDRMEALTAGELDQTVNLRFPMAHPTIFGALTFLVQHDTYHLGQLSLLRKHAGLPAMSYQGREGGQ